VCWWRTRKRLQLISKRNRKEIDTTMLGHGAAGKNTIHGRYWGAPGAASSQRESTNHLTVDSHERNGACTNRPGEEGEGWRKSYGERAAQVWHAEV